MDSKFLTDVHTDGNQVVLALDLNPMTGVVEQSDTAPLPHTVARIPAATAGRVWQSALRRSDDLESSPRSFAVTFTASLVGFRSGACRVRVSAIADD